MKNNQYRLFYVLALLQGLVFYSSIATLYRQAQGISLLEMGIIESVFAFCMVAFEIPWGIACDRIGYKKTLLICNFLYFISKVIFYKADHFILFLLERILLAIVSAGISGCDSALLYLSIDPKKSEKIFGIYQMMSVLGMVISSITFTLIIQDDFQKAALWTIFPYLIAFVLTFFIRDVKSENMPKISIKQLWNQFVKHHFMILFLIASALLLDATHTLTIFYNQLQYERANIPMSWYGVIFMGMQLLALSSGLCGNITKRIGKYRLLSILYLVSMVSIVLLFISDGIWISITMIALLTICESFYYPLLYTIENELLHSEYRSSMLSMYSMVMNVTMMMTQYAFGQASNTSLINAYLLAMVLVALGFVLFQIWRKKYVMN